MGRAMTLFLLQWEEEAAETLYYLIQSDGDDQMNRLALTLLQRPSVCRRMSWPLTHGVFTDSSVTKMVRRFYFFCRLRSSQPINQHGSMQGLQSCVEMCEWTRFEESASSILST